MALENYLKNIYYNPSNPASFSGPVCEKRREIYDKQI